ncbi:MAG: hypothetical protein GY870_10650 [archaeon]|nr:hypothetical protein [archaeon]
MQLEAVFFDIVKVVGTRSTCYRNEVSSVIVRDKKIISTGYNGAPYLFF